MTMTAQTSPPLTAPAPASPPESPTRPLCEEVCITSDDRFPSWIRCERDYDHPGHEHSALLRSSFPLAYLRWTT